MSGMKNWMLGAAVVAGGMAMGPGTAQAAEFGVYTRGPVAYVPPCPGPGYVWMAGYQADGYWIPGRWAMGAHRDVLEGERRGFFARGFDREHLRPAGGDRNRDGEHYRR
jgi:hypothetical protein